MEINKIHNIAFQDADFPDNSLFITDPPYNIGYKYLEFNDKVSERQYADMFLLFTGKRCVFIHYPEEMIKYIIPAMGMPTEIVSWVYNSNLNRQHRMIAWFNCEPNFNKVKQPYKNPTDKRVKELVANGSDGVKIYDWWEINLVKNVSEEKTDYTNQIPEEVIARIIKTTANLGDVIVDPFSGSGTTCAVASKLQYDYIGTDVSKKAVKISTERIPKTLFTIN